MILSVLQKSSLSEAAADPPAPAPPALLGQIADDLPDPLSVFDRDGRAVYVNPAFLRLVCPWPERVLGLTPIEMDVWPPIAAGAFHRTLLHVLRSGLPSEIEVPHPHDLEPRVFRVRFVPLHDPDGSVRGALSVGSDITQRKRDAAQQTLLMHALNRVHEGAWLMERDARIRYVNDAACRSLGYTRKELLSLTILDVDPILTRADWDQSWEEIMTCGSRLIPTFHRTKTGRVFPVEILVSYIEYGGQGYSLALVRDVSEARAHAQALATARDQAYEASRVKSQFLANMSHEIRTPMNGVLGMLHLLLDTRLSGEQRECAQTALRSGEALLGILNDILDLSKIEAGKLSIEAVPVDVCALSRDVAALYAEMARKKGLSLSCLAGHGALTEPHPAPPPAPLVRADPVRLRQVLSNLVGNAIKFTESGRVTLQLLLETPPSIDSAQRSGAPSIDSAQRSGAPSIDSAQRSGAPSIDSAQRSGAPSIDGTPPGESRLRCHFSVSDTGIGIPAEVLPRLFQPFVQADTSTTRRFGGTGLGLAICQQIVNLMGGRISVQSVPGQGATFRFTLEFPTVAQPTAPPAPPPQEAEASQLIGRRVLLAEDNLVNQRVAQRMLEKLGLQVDTVGTGAQAVAAVRGGGYDAVFMDCQMPEMDGYAATLAIRAEESPPTRLPIIAMTAHAMAGDRERCLESGMDDYLSKPLSRGELQAALLRAFPPGDREPPPPT